MTSLSGGSYWEHHLRRKNGLPPAPRNLDGILVFPRYFFPSLYPDTQTDGACSATPKDLTHFNPALDQPQDSDVIRFQGYPDQGFETARQPLTMDSKLPIDSIENPFFGNKIWFDPRNPKVHGSPRGLQYGSEGGLPSPAPVRNLSQRTSAELKKYHQYQLDAIDQIREYKARKQQQLLAEKEENRQSMARSVENFPFGKSGSGALASQHHKKQKFTEIDTVRLRPPARDQNYESEYGLPFHDAMSRPGGGAPCRTQSGNVKTQFTSHGDIRNPTHSTEDQGLLKDFRYRNKDCNLSEVLAQQVKEKSQRVEQQKQEDLRLEKDMINNSRFGVQGGRRTGGRFITLTSDPEKLRSNEKRETKRTNSLPDRSMDDQTPWGKGYGTPRRDQFGMVIGHKNSSKEFGVVTYPDSAPKEGSRYRRFDSMRMVFPDKLVNPVGNSLDLDHNLGGAGAPIKNDQGQPRTRLPITMKKSEYGDATIREAEPAPSTDPELSTYDPWGRSGAGAPLKDRQGNIRTQVYGMIQDEKRSANARQRGQNKEHFRTELQRQMETQIAHKKQQDSELKRGSGEFASIIRKGTVGYPHRDPNTGYIDAKQHLCSSDVTREKILGHVTKDPTHPRDIERAAEERGRLKKLDRLKERYDTQHHGAAMDQFWGRPGGGAPLPKGARKGRLEDLIYSPRKEPVDFYSKNLVENQAPYTYVRNTTHSTSNNMYDYCPDVSRSPNTQNAGVKPPYAVGEL